MFCLEEYYIKLGQLIYWKDGKPYWNCDRGSRKLKDRIAGSLRNNKYRHISTSIEGNQKFIYAHRLHWFMTYGEIPTMLDHKNSQRDDNRIENLRFATPSQNSRNRKPVGSSKYLGVSWHKRAKKWVSFITINNTTRYLGLFKCEYCAAYAYDKALIKNGLTEFGSFNFKKEVI